MKKNISFGYKEGTVFSYFGTKLWIKKSLGVLRISAIESNGKISSLMALYCIKKRAFKNHIDLILFDDKCSKAMGIVFRMVGFKKIIVPGDPYHAHFELENKKGGQNEKK